MRYFIDTEFMDLGNQRPIHLVSIGIKREDGLKYYAENEDAPLHLANAWTKKNVVPHLHRSKAKPRHAISQEVLDFIVGTRKYGPPTFWGFYSDFDWVVFTQLMGTMMDLPDSWPKYCLDLKQVWAMLGGDKLASTPDGYRHVIELPKRAENQGLDDSDWNHQVWCVLNEKWREKMGVDLP